MAQNERNLWILEQLEKHKNENLEADNNDVVTEFFRSQTEGYSEEDEIIKMISLFSVVNFVIPWWIQKFTP